MKDIVKLVNGSELQKQLEPLYELKSDIANLKTEISKNTSAKFYTILQVCEILHLSRSTVYRMIRNGNLKAHKAYRRVLVSEASINNALIPINGGRFYRPPYFKTFEFI